MLDNLYNKLKAINLWNLLWISLVLSEVFTAIMDIIIGLIWHGKIDVELMLIGAIDAFVVALFVSIILILIFREIRNYEGHSEEAIVKAKEEWERTFNSMSDLIMILDTKHKVVRTNKAMAEKLKLTPSETVGITCYEHVHGLTEPPSFCPHSLCLQDGQGHSAELYEERLGGHYLVTVTPLFNAQGEVTGSVHTAKDITESKRAEEALKDINAKLRTLINTIPDMVVFKDLVGRHMVVNRAVEEVTGHASGEITGKTIEELLPPDAAAACRKSDEAAMRQSVPTHDEERIVQRDGSVSCFDMVKAPMTDDQGAVVGLVAVGRDITERKRMEQSLQESEAKFRTLFESASDALFIIDMDGTILDVNAVAYERLGYTKAELLSLHLSQLDHPSYAAILPERMERMKQYGRIAIESAHVRKDGSVMPVEINAGTMELNGKKVIFSVIRDITERKQAEQNLLEKTKQLEDLSRDLEKRVAAEIRVRIKNERMMIQQSKLAAMGEMLGAIAHQWRQPLNVVGLIVQNMEDAHAFGKLDKEYLEKMVEKAMAQILRMSKTIDDFRGFYKPDKEKTLFDAMRAVGDVLSLVSAQLVGDSIVYRLTCHTHGKTFENEAEIVCCTEKTIKGFKNEFEHVILNLVNNARDAILEKRAHGGGAEKGLLSLDFYSTAGKVIVKVSDNGGGILPEAINRIFDPYFTTKDPTKGTGLGLYMSKVIVEDHMRGKLSAENAETGAIMTIELPQPENGAHHENTEAV